MFSDNLIRAIRRVSGDIVPDIVEGLGVKDGRDPEIVAEMTLDADRLKMFGHPKANEELKELFKEHGWEPVKEEAMKHVCTW